MSLQRGNTTKKDAKRLSSNHNANDREELIHKSPRHDKSKHHPRWGESCALPVRPLRYKRPPHLMRFFLQNQSSQFDSKDHTIFRNIWLIHLPSCESKDGR
eukprot:TRINITY_DN21347_c0_g1_i10.p1 TRINITY_DN21347_c0_g1~~TRINITY_DN21347_c0_g1_i10.p1  ORF type:complete len:101 (+),score=4.75 TRINITY_DN21347_c0_g1_i10:302-604(+)